MISTYMATGFRGICPLPPKHFLSASPRLSNHTACRFTKKALLSAYIGPGSVVLLRARPVVADKTLWNFQCILAT